MPKSTPPVSIKLRRMLLMEYCEWKYDSSQYVIFQRTPGWAEVNRQLHLLEADLDCRITVSPHLITITLGT